LELELINSIVDSPSVHLMLFISLLMYVLRSSQKREELMGVELQKVVPVLDKILTRLDIIEKKLEDK